MAEKLSRRGEFYVTVLSTFKVFFSQSCSSAKLRAVPSISHEVARVVMTRDFTWFSRVKGQTRGIVRTTTL